MNNFDDPRKSSFDYSMRSETSYKNQKKPQATQGRLFNLEDEDNMIDVEITPEDDLTDNFLAVSYLEQKSTVDLNPEEEQH